MSTLMKRISSLEALHRIIDVEQHRMLKDAGISTGEGLRIQVPRLILIEKYSALLREFQDDEDTELAHAAADTFICDLLIELGYREVVEEYDKIEK